MSLGVKSELEKFLMNNVANIGIRGCDLFHACIRCNEANWWFELGVRVFSHVG